MTVSPNTEAPRTVASPVDTDLSVWIPPEASAFETSMEVTAYAARR